MKKGLTYRVLFFLAFSLAFNALNAQNLYFSVGDNVQISQARGAASPAIVSLGDPNTAYATVALDMSKADAGGRVSSTGVLNNLNLAILAKGSSSNVGALNLNNNASFSQLILDLPNVDANNRSVVNLNGGSAKIYGKLEIKQGQLKIYDGLNANGYNQAISHKAEKVQLKVYDDAGVMKPSIFSLPNPNNYNSTESSNWPILGYISGGKPAEYAAQVTVESHFKQGPRAWHAISPGVYNSEYTLKDAYVSNYGTSAAGYGTHITGGSSENGFDIFSGITSGSSIYALNKDHYVAADNLNVAGATNPFFGYAGTGLLLFVRGDRGDASKAFDTQMSSATILRSHGNLAFGTVIVGGSYQSGENPNKRSFVYTESNGNLTSTSGTVAANDFTLIGNPYWNYLDLNSSLIVKNNIASTFWLVNPSTNGYATYNYSTNLSSNASGMGGDVRYLQPGQAFVVQATATPVELLINPEAISSSPEKVEFSNKQAIEGLDLMLTSNNGKQILSEAKVAYGVQRRDGKITQNQTMTDTEDSQFLSGFAEGIAIQRERLLTIDARSPLSGLEKDSIPLQMNALKSATYALRIKTNNLPADKYVVLVDKEKEVDAKGWLLVNKSGLLADGNPGQDFVFSKGKDNQTNRFQVWVVNDWQSLVAHLENREAPLAWSLQLYPNPSTDKISVRSGQLAGSSVKIRDILGREVFSTQVPANQLSPLEINISKYNAGSYLIQMEKEGRRLAERFIKE